MFENPVKEKLKRGEAVLGASCGVTDELANRLTINTGIDFLWIDTEHSAFGLEDIRMLPILARQKGCVPLVRVAGLDSSLIKKALDLGASAVMIPQVNNAEEARRAVHYAKYPPQGGRGVSPMWTFFMDVPWDQYLPNANDEICIIAQIESQEGIDSIEEIAAVDGIDVLLAGPADLSAALGVIGQFQNPKLQEFLAGFPERVKKCGKAPGIALGSAKQAAKALEQGYQFVSFGSLLFSGVKGLTEDLAMLRGGTR
jgi:4-hydroxy-2-oxoheptanedioate aldolase